MILAMNTESLFMFGSIASETELSNHSDVYNDG